MRDEKRITAYKPLEEVTLFSGEKYFIESEKKEAFYRDLNERKFVRIGGDMVAVSAIKTVRKADDYLESSIAWLPDETKRKVRLEVKRRNDELLPNTPGTIDLIVAKFNK